MSKSVELLASSEDAEPAHGESQAEERSRLNLNGSRQLSRSATELRGSPKGGESSSAGRSPEHHCSRTGDSGVIQRLRHSHRHVSVAQRTHTFFATLKSRWVRSRSKERKKSKDASTLLDSQPKGSGNQESDYAADYSSEHSRSSSATQSPARHYLNHPESPLARTSRGDKIATLQDDSGSGRCSDGSPKAQHACSSTTGAEHQDDEAHQQHKEQGAESQDGPTSILQDEHARRRELALRQHAFFQLRLHLRRGANLVAMDRCGASDPYVKIKSTGRLLHKSRTVHRELNPVWDESVTLPIEDPFQPLNFKVFDYDWGLQDDFMGAALLDLTQLDLGHPQDITLELKDPARPRQHLGEIFISATLWPRNQQEKEQCQRYTAHSRVRSNFTISPCTTFDHSYLPEQKHLRFFSQRMNGARENCPTSASSTSSLTSSSATSKLEARQPANDPSPSVMASGPDRVLERLAEGLRQHPELLEQYVVLSDRLNALPENDSRLRVPQAVEISLPDEQHQPRPSKRDKLCALKMLLERRVELVEKVIETRAERAWEGCMEKRPWLQPLEAWVVERYKTRLRDMDANNRGYSSDSEINSPKSKIKDGKKSSPLVDVETSEKSDAEVKRILEPLLKINEIPKNRKRSISSSSKKSDGPSPIPTPSAIRDVVETLRPPVESETSISRPESPDFFDKIKENFKDKIEDIHRYFQRSSRLADVNRKLKSQIWSSVVTIVLVEAKNLLPMDIDGLSDPYVKFRLGTEKYKSKVANKTLSPVWLEQFDLHLYEDPYLGQELEVTVWDRDRSHQDDLMGRTVIDLATLERETTHRLWRELEDGAGSIFLLLTISGTTASETISDLAAHEETPHERALLIQKYSMANTLKRPRDVGHLTVKVYRAQGLAAADLGGKSDPFCVLELVNSRLQTQTEYKTLSPNWQKIFTFNVKDINSVLEITVYDEDRDHKVEFLGKVAVPLLRVRNGEKRWYALKDKKLRCRAKGNNPQILLELTVIWNIIRACIRTLNPKEKKYMEPEVKFKRQVFLRNVLRLKAIIVIFIDLGKYIQSCWEWENKMRSVVALVLFVVIVYYFEPYMIPTIAFLILLKYYVVAVLTGAPLPHQMTVHIQDSTDPNSDDGPPTPGEDDDDEDDKDKEEKKSLKERLQAIQEVTQTVQNSIGYIASLCEKVKNLFNFTIPYLSYLAMLLTILGITVLYFIPVRYLILAWGVNKFARKIFRPHTVPNNELLDLISRVPDDEELLNYRELKSVPTADCEIRGGGTASGASGSGAGGATATRREMRKRHKAAA